MAIPEGRLSTVAVPDEYLPPEGPVPHPLTTYEAGPYDVEDTTKGILYQTWRLTWDMGTGDFTLYAETEGWSYVIGNSFDVVSASFTFDKAGRVTFAWTNSVSSYLYWYDTGQGQTVTDDIGNDIFTPTVYLDDKRNTQNQANDMLLWYTKSDGAGKYNLYMKIQRERFLIEHEMATGLDAYYIIACGMHKGLRVQLQLRSIGYGDPIPPPTIEPGNLGFESGDVNWTHEAGSEFSINENNPRTGTWNATLESTGAYSRFVNDTFFPVTGNQDITIDMAAMGTVGPGVNFGYQAYDSSFNYLGRFEYGINVTGSWVLETWDWTVAANVAHIKLCVSSNGVIGSFHIDDFNLVS